MILGLALFFKNTGFKFQLHLPKLPLILLTSITLFISACSVEADKTDQAIKGLEESSDSLARATLAVTNWQYKYDFDGDLIADSILIDYTGGAHCCYKLGVQLSKRNQPTEIPFLVNGGYVVYDLSMPDNFNILDYNKDGIYEMFISLKHYEKEELKAIKQTYKFTSTEIILAFTNETIQVKDYH